MPELSKKLAKKASVPHCRDSYIIARFLTVGKTHLAVAVGSRMAQLGYTVRFITAQKLANGVLSATNRNEVEKLLVPLIKCQLLILDELGYLPLDERVGPILYEAHGFPITE